MDLISREAAIEFAKEQMAKETGAYSRGRNAALLVMKSALDNPDAIPSAPAVPLDMLCEWLADYAAPPANASEEKALGNHETRALIWRHFFEKMIQSK